MKIVALTTHVEGYLDSVQEAAPEAEIVEAPDDEALVGEVVDAEVLLTGHFGEELVDAAGQLKWIQVSAAGVEWMPMEALARRGCTVTNAAGIHAIPVAETAIALLSGVARRVYSTTRNRVKGEWVRPGDVFELFEKTVGVIAMGGIGRAFAERAHGLGMRVVGVDVTPASKPDCVDELRGIDELDWLLESSDVVCMTAPDTPKSHHMMDADRFAQMKEGSIFLNVSRGGLVDTEALIDAIDSGKFFGVGLDVIEGEPLEADHPIWSRDDVLITPHVGGMSPRRIERMIELFVENLRRYQAGGRLLNVVDLEAGF